MNKDSVVEGSVLRDCPGSLAHDESPFGLHEPEDVLGSSDDELLAKCIESQRSLPRAPSLRGPPSVEGTQRNANRRSTDHGLQRVVSPLRSRTQSGIIGNAPDMFKRVSIVEIDEYDEYDEHIREKLEEIVHSGTQHLQELRLSGAHIVSDNTALHAALVRASSLTVTS
jgi:hypothetical protein